MVRTRLTIPTKVPPNGTALSKARGEVVTYQWQADTEDVQQAGQYQCLQRPRAAGNSIPDNAGGHGRLPNQHEDPGPLSGEAGLSVYDDHYECGAHHVAYPRAEMLGWEDYPAMACR